VARPGHYIVKPGDTLIRIALDHGQNYRDIAAWNGLENPNLIEVGQELRVVRPNPAVSRPSRRLRRRVRPVPPGRACGAADGVRREPKGGKLPYSEQAWAQAQKPEAPLAVAKVEPKPEPPRQTRKPGPRRSREAKPEAKPNPQWRQDRLGLAHVRQGHRGFQRNLQQGRRSRRQAG
jgi:lipoprotein NlpD